MVGFWEIAFSKWITGFWDLRIRKWYSVLVRFLVSLRVIGMDFSLTLGIVGNVPGILVV